MGLEWNKRMTPSVNGTSATNGMYMYKDLSLTHGWSNVVMIEDLLALPIGKRLRISVGFENKSFIPH
jgi:hypothetical protein